LKNSIKKILITHSSNDNYGASKVLISIINILIKNGFDIYLILPNNGPLNNNKTIKKTNLQIINMGIFRKKYLTVLGLINRLYYIIKSSIYIRKILKKNQIDLVYNNTSTLISPSVAAKLVGIPSIYHVHEIPNSNSIYSKFITIFLNNFSRDIICVSKSVYDFWTNKGIKNNKLKIIYNGFNFKKNKSKIIRNDIVVFSCVSRIIPYKGHALLIKLFDQLCKKNDNIYLQIVGDTLPQYQKYLDKLKLDISKRGLLNKIKFMGFRKDVISILENSNFLIHTPISPDPLPTVIFEAIQSKVPVISNNLGGAYEILNNGKNGLIIKNELTNKSVQKILNYINNKKLQKENVENAFTYVCNNFSLEKFRRKILNTIE
tara:strand:+ start:865 stop:1989 length:1125 start_codon:yes stop_codon:yes gene_type:complete